MIASRLAAGLLVSLPVLAAAGTDSAPSTAHPLGFWWVLAAVAAVSLALLVSLIHHRRLHASHFHTPLAEFGWALLPLLLLWALLIPAALDMVPVKRSPGEVRVTPTTAEYANDG